MSNGGLPMPSAMEEKLGYRRGPSRPWTRTVHLPIPGVTTRRLRLLVPTASLPLGKRRPLILVCLAAFAVFCTFAVFSRGISNQGTDWDWSKPVDPPTLVFKREDLQRVWLWTVTSGQYPTTNNIPKQIGLHSAPQNPAIPKRRSTPSRFRQPVEDTETYGVGAKRVYLDIQAQPPNVAYPPRPVPGSIVDMDVVMKHCDFSKDKYVRDCLEVLRLGGGLDNGMRVRRGSMDDWKYIYVLQENSTAAARDLADDSHVGSLRRPSSIQAEHDANDPNAGLTRKRGSEWETQVVLPPAIHNRPVSSSNDPCDSDYPRIFHMFWTGPFTDKPYMALMSWLFTQNTAIHMAQPPTSSPVCRPQFWVWINPGPAATVPNPSALKDMFTQIGTNPWAAPFLHPRFKDVIKFKMWNTTEQLDGIPEIKDEWRELQETLFNSGGHIINVPSKKEEEEEEEEESSTEASSSKSASSSSKKVDEDDMLNRMGSKSSSSYDRLSVILSDMARFVLTHRFGGVYLDADTIFLRDWEEIWGYKGAFAYRWSRLPKYNTALLKMNKGSALGTFLFRTALRNGLDFHPMTISRYMADAYSEALLLRLPDALFDAAWLNTESFQRERPPQPYFYDFENFFEAKDQYNGAPATLGFEGFFRGSYSYHWHNYWWRPFDKARNFPDLGPRFAASETMARQSELIGIHRNKTIEELWGETDVAEDKRDLDWSAVMKRTFESYIRGERPNMYGEWISW
ncbi:hypothetical protein DL96DRAFT_1596660 [Flagelloscypha sp. PMI_526]|nr:hypothetical protein DL96DRAFT_1596660 [Flagelloscypha sp. PMI_526]